MVDTMTLDTVETTDTEDTATPDTVETTVDTVVAMAADGKQPTHGDNAFDHALAAVDNAFFEILRGDSRFSIKHGLLLL